MKFKVTKRGVHGVSKGEIVEIDGDKVPAWLKNKGEVVDGRTAVTNPAEGGGAPDASAQERQVLLAEIASALDTDQFLGSGAPDVRAVNELLDKDVKPFTATERDQLWPGIAEALKAAG